MQVYIAMESLYSRPKRVNVQSLQGKLVQVQSQCAEWVEKNSEILFHISHVQTTLFMHSMTMHAVFKQACLFLFILCSYEAIKHLQLWLEKNSPICGKNQGLC